jgi:signal transduction histidine kinase
VAWLLAGVACLLLIAIGWIVLRSRRRHREQQMARLQAEAEFGAIWNERNRLAREVHDTLAQGLGAISLHLQLTRRKLPTDSPAHEPLREASELASSNLAEARRAIWNMRSQTLEDGDLASALEGIVKSLADGAETNYNLQLKGRPCRLAPVTENNLLRVGQEAITNAIRHAGACMIRVVLEFEDRRVRLSVQDDGCGFDPAHPPLGKQGFGLMGMRERVEEMRGELRLTSSEQGGTVVEISVPTQPSAGRDRIRT